MTRSRVTSGRGRPVAAVSDELDRRDAAELADLTYHWGDAFHVTLDPAGKWVALSKLDPSADPLIAGSAQQLRLLIHRAYRGRPRPQSPAPTDQGSL